MEHSPLASDSEAPPSVAINDVTVLPHRALWGVIGLVVLTAGSLGLAWCLPDVTVLHFLWVTQGVPILYFVLAWWGICPAPKVEADAS